MAVVKLERVLQPYHIAFYALPCVTLVFLVDVFDPFNLPKLAVLLIFTFAAFGCLLGNLKESSRSHLSELDISQKIFLSALTSFVAIVFLGGVLRTESMSHALWGNSGRNIGFLYYLCVCLLSGVVSVAHWKKNDRSIHNAIYVMTIPFILYSFLQVAKLDPVAWQNPFDPMLGTLGNPNFSSGLLGSLSGYFFFKILVHKGLGATKLVDVVLLVCCVALTLLNSSTQGKLLLLIVPIFTLYYFMNLKWSSRWLRFFSQITMLFLIIIAFFSFLGEGPLGNRLYVDTIAIRYEYWRISILSLLTFPLFGLGTDSYIEGFRLFRSSNFANARSLGVVSDNAHNFLLHIGATSGVIALLLVIVIFGMIFFRAFRYLTFPTKFPIQELPIAVLWILLFVQSQVSIEQIGIGVWVWILGGVIINRGIKQNSVEPKARASISSDNYFRNFGRELAFIFGALAVIVVVPRVQEDAKFGRLLVSPINSQTNPATIDSKVEEFTSFTLEEPKRVIGIANAYFLANWNQKGIEYLERLRNMDSRNWESRDALALAYGSLGQPEKAIEVRTEMKSLDPNNWINIFELANLYISVSDNEKARQNYIIVRTISPNSAEGMKASEWLG